MAGKILPPLILNAAERSDLERAIQSGDHPKLSFRAGIVLGSARGWTNSAVAQALGTTAHTVGKWRARFIAGGIDALLDRPRSGRPRSVSDARRSWIVELASGFGTEDLARRSGRGIARLVNCGATTVNRVLKDAGVRPSPLMREAPADPGDAISLDSIPDVPGERPRRAAKEKVPFYQPCQCNRPQCTDCRIRRFLSICGSIIQRWERSFGPVKRVDDEEQEPAAAILITLNLRADPRVEPDWWLDRIARYWNRLKGAWKRRFGRMPPHIRALQWTKAGTPHLHIVVPKTETISQKRLSEWLRPTWMVIIGEVQTTRQQYFVSVRVRNNVPRTVRYALDDVWRSRTEVAPEGTRRYRRWSTSRDW